MLPGQSMSADPTGAGAVGTLAAVGGEDLGAEWADIDWGALDAVDGDGGGGGGGDLAADDDDMLGEAAV